jgi:hypothetical protein
MDLLEGREAWRVPFFYCSHDFRACYLTFYTCSAARGLDGGSSKNKKWLFQFLLLVSSFADRFANTKAVRSTTLLLHCRFGCVTLVKFKLCLIQLTGREISTQAHSSTLCL